MLLIISGQRLLLLRKFLVSWLVLFFHPGENIEVKFIWLNYTPLSPLKSILISRVEIQVTKITTSTLGDWRTFGNANTLCVGVCVCLFQ